MDRFDAPMTAAGGQLQPIPPPRRRALMHEWRQVYAARLFAATGRWTHRGYDWHTFSFGYARAQDREAALAAYRREQADRLIVCPADDRRPAFEVVGGRPPDFAGYLQEITIWPADLGWTMAFTHEDGWFGPYFCRREWAELP